MNDMPALDTNNYPTKEWLKKLSRWNNYLEDNAVEKYLDEVVSVFNSMTYGSATKVLLPHPINPRLYYTFHTYGWSGGEAIVEALLKNQLLHALAWESSNRSGTHTFDIKKGT